MGSPRKHWSPPRKLVVQVATYSPAERSSLGLLKGCQLLPRLAEAMLVLEMEEARSETNWKRQAEEAQSEPQAKLVVPPL